LEYKDSGEPYGLPFLFVLMFNDLLYSKRKNA
jgi:hypothetical protein